MARTGRTFPSRQSLGPRAELAATVPPPVLPPPLIVVQGMRRDHVHREHRLPDTRFLFQRGLLASIPPPIVTTPVTTIFAARGRFYRRRTPPRDAVLTPVMAASVPPPVLPPQTVFQAHGRFYRRRTPPRKQQVLSLSAFSIPVPPVKPLVSNVRRLSELRRPHSRLGVFISEVRTVVTLPPARPSTKPRLVLNFRETLRDIRRKGRVQFIHVPRHLFVPNEATVGASGKAPRRLDSPMLRALNTVIRRLPSQRIRNS